VRPAREAAIRWVRKGQQETDVFDRFVALWFAFNALYNAYFEGDERAAIRELLYESGSPLTSGWCAAFLRNPGVVFFGQRIIRSVHRYGQDSTEDAVRVRNRSEPPKRRVVKLVMILYLVRCNLFHGAKDYAREADQEVVRRAAELLEPILKAFLHMV
jgi:hypothetical protein